MKLILVRGGTTRGFLGEKSQFILQDMHVTIKQLYLYQITRPIQSLEVSTFHGKTLDVQTTIK